MRIRGAQGNVVTLDVPASLTRFDQVKVGDQVAIADYDRVSLKPKPAGEPDVDRTSDPTTTPTPGLAPGGTRAIQRVTTATIDAWDPTTRMLTFTTPGGQYTRRVSETLDPSVVAGLKVGDRVDVTRTAAVRISVEPAAAAPQAPVAPAPDTFRHKFTVSFLWGPDNIPQRQSDQGWLGDISEHPAQLQRDELRRCLRANEYVQDRCWLPHEPANRDDAEPRVLGELVQQVQVGTVGDASAPLLAKFDDYSYWGIEGGQRFYFARVRFTPFVGYFVGINRLKEINGNFTAVAVGSQAALTVDNGQFFDKSWALSLGPTGGVLIGLGPIEVMGEVAFRYMGGLSDVDPLSEAGLSDINSESSRWSFPILVGARVRF